MIFRLCQYKKVYLIKIKALDAIKYMKIKIVKKYMNMKHSNSIHKPESMQDSFELPQKIPFFFSRGIYISIKGEHFLIPLVDK